MARERDEFGRERRSGSRSRSRSRSHSRGQRQRSRSREDKPRRRDVDDRRRSRERPRRGSPERRKAFRSPSPAAAAEVKHEMKPTAFAKRSESPRLATHAGRRRGSRSPSEEPRMADGTVPDRIKEEPLPKFEPKPREPSPELEKGTEYERIQEKRKKLPIFVHRKRILEAIKDNPVIVLTGETGSGKSTQIAQYLLDAEPELRHAGTADPFRIAVTQPRRVAAASVARRVAQERNGKVGDEVGFVVRFTNCTSPDTRITFLTDGCLLREVLEDKELRRYSVVILDEAHERTVNTDVLFGLMKQTLATRTDLRVVVTSATLDMEQFSSFFGNCPYLAIPGRTFPVEILYRPLESLAPIRRKGKKGRGIYREEALPDYVAGAVSTVLDLHFRQPPGDVLVFLAGQQEIERACQLVHDRIQEIYDDDPASFENVPDLLALPLYGGLEPEQQMAVFQDSTPHVRKVVFATNVAETSLTVDGIVYVIDSGYCKEHHYDAQTGIASLDIVKISQVAAQQRSGRAGRTREGICYRLYEKAIYDDMAPRTVPEIQRTSLGTVVLSLKALGVVNVVSFDFIDPPTEESLVKSVKQLYFLGALDDAGKITELGRQMADFPLDPPLARTLLESPRLDCAGDMATLVTLLAGESIFHKVGKARRDEVEAKRKALKDDALELYPRTHSLPLGDHLLLLATYRMYLDSRDKSAFCREYGLSVKILQDVKATRDQLAGLMQKYGERVPSPTASPARPEDLLRALACGFFWKAAKKRTDKAYHVGNKVAYGVFIHPTSILFDKDDELDWVVFHSLVWTTRGYMSTVSPIEWSWIQELYEKVEGYNENKLVGVRRPKRSATEALGEEAVAKPEPAKVSRNNDDAAVSAARARYLARKKADGLA